MLRRTHPAAHAPVKLRRAHRARRRRDPANVASFQRFLRFTTAMFVVPLATMTVAFMVLEPLVAKPADRMVYAGVAAIVAVQAVIVAFLVSAWNEDDVPMPAKPAPPPPKKANSAGCSASRRASPARRDLVDAQGRGGRTRGFYLVSAITRGSRGGATTPSWRHRRLRPERVPAAQLEEVAELLAAAPAPRLRPTPPQSGSPEKAPSRSRTRGSTDRRRQQREQFLDLV